MSFVLIEYLFWRYSKASKHLEWKNHSEFHVSICIRNAFQNNRNERKWRYDSNVLVSFNSNERQSKNHDKSILIQNLLTRIQWFMCKCVCLLHLLSLICLNSTDFITHSPSFDMKFMNESFKFGCSCNHAGNILIIYWD